MGLWSSGLPTFTPCATLVVGSTRSLTTMFCGCESGLGCAGAEVPTMEMGAIWLGDGEDGCAQSFSNLCDLRLQATWPGRFGVHRSRELLGKTPCFKRANTMFPRAATVAQVLPLPPKPAKCSPISGTPRPSRCLIHGHTVSGWTGGIGIGGERVRLAGSYGMMPTKQMATPKLPPNSRSRKQRQVRWR